MIKINFSALLIAFVLCFIVYIFDLYRNSRKKIMPINHTFNNMKLLFCTSHQPIRYYINNRLLIFLVFFITVIVDNSFQILSGNLVSVNFKFNTE